MSLTTKSMRDAFGKQLTEMTLQDPSIVALDGDLGNSTRLAFVENENQDAFLQMGIAEQNMVGVAAGLATCGIKPWVCSFAAFITRRTFDQLVVSVDQPHLNVKLVGAYSGLLTSNTGKTHHSFEDITLMASLPNMVVLSPGDAQETVRMMQAAGKYEGPVYIRLSRDENLEFLPGSEEPFEIGKAKWLNSGKKIACVSTGAMSPRVYKAIIELKAEGMSLTHVHFPTIKPLDRETVIKLAESHEHLVTVEEHFVRNGFGSLVNEVTSATCPVQTTRIGIQNQYSQCGKNDELLDYHGLSTGKLKMKLAELFEGR
ncbi:transketolase family protein [Salipaludibacillus aurantiacus]|uniref:Transketolase n=1 Tax=Salipaludibacillus aurantiacus TaxID=1601833 RepID=A0A1H9UAS7_9BACI|nr:transketolase C-terminal domain-containing protein [Salipaludibacillus aurantiacus]SES06650.1 transketolase [Salipaludibacillus aurantiacus]